MGFIDRIFSLVWDISDYFYNAYLTVSGWVWPFYLLMYPMYYLYQASRSLLTPIAQFGDWVYDTTSRVANILIWNTIWSYILSYVPNLLQVRDWFYYWWTNVFGVVTTWWSTTQQTVLAWVNDAKNLATSLFNQANTWLANLQSSWDSFKGMIPSISEVIAWWRNWWGSILGPLSTWWMARLLDVQGLINSSLATWFPFYDDLVRLWGDIKLFFSDPEQYVYNKLDSFFERFW